ncbi:AMP-binding protein [Massilia sp. R2A-15]|uniref:AMP-binding protein n=1 Tax=Massilia sp. R2A-15 TaxID=3064278 RepID=UPI002732EA06|nr:AMP-binding protein [Massilia sp. R2A-15]WLI90723.1 AMP-binding protein [Massilia sp. R2A-15]
MQRHWLSSYPPGIPSDVDVGKFASFNALLAWIADRYGAQPAFSNQGATLSWHELARLSAQFAAYLQQVAGLGRGDRIALMLPNLLQYPVALFGAFQAGCTVVNVNPQYTPRELQHQLADSGARAIVVLDNFAHTLEQVLPLTPVHHVITTAVGDLLPFPKAQIVDLVVKHVRHMVPAWHIGGAVSLHDALKAGKDLALVDVHLNAADIAFLQYTGGTTGVPKGAILTHGNVLANVEQTAAWVQGFLEEGKETAIIPLPLYHVFALTATLTFCRLGAHIVLVTDPRDIGGLIKLLRHTPFNVIIGVNTLFNALLEAPEISQVHPAGMKLAVAGGMAVQRAVAERWQAVFGVPLLEGYGLTETSPIVCANPPNLAQFSGAVGLPLPSTEVAIFDEADRELGPGETGEICVRGPQVMQGYWNMPDETERALTADGWLRTGDIGVIDERGYVRLIDRKKDMIVVSGFKVYPNEVEQVVGLHPGVFEVAAIRAPDEHSDEVVKIVVVRRDPELTAEALLAYCRKSLSAYKVPKYVVFRDEPLPKSNIGKILRRVVMEEEAQRSAGPVAAG